MSSLRSVLLLAVLLFSVLSLSAAQTNMIVNGDFETQPSLSGWMTPQGVNDTGINVANRLRALSYGTCTSSPCGWAYTGSYSALWESSSLNQSIVQTVAVTGGTQYLLSFFLSFTDGDTTDYMQVSAQFNDGSAPVVLLTPNGGGGAQQSFCSGSAKSQPPFWWSQFTFTVAAPSAASAMNLTFYGYDSEFGFLVDTVTMYPASGNSQPAAPPATPVVPSNNLLMNGNFETGSVAPWREASGDNPYGLSGQTFSGEGAYSFNSYAPHFGIPCPEGNYCFVFGAPQYSLPIQQTVTIPSGTTSSYTLSFYWYAGGGYNSSNAADGGSALVVGYAWNNASTTATSGSTVFATYNTTAAGSATSYNTFSKNIGSPPSGTTSITLQMQGYFYATEYVVDYVQLTASGVSQSQSPLVYTCSSATTATSALTLPAYPPSSSGAAQSFSTGALTTVAMVSAALVLLLSL